jgi:hypothetical protein
MGFRFERSYVHVFVTKSQTEGMTRTLKARGDVTLLRGRERERERNYLRKKMHLHYLENLFGYTCEAPVTLSPFKVLVLELVPWI